MFHDTLKAEYKSSEFLLNREQNGGSVRMTEMAVKQGFTGKFQSLAESSDILLNVADFQAVFIYFAKRYPSEPEFNKL